MANKVILNDGGNVLYPQTTADNVLFGGLKLNERYGPDFFILKDSVTGLYKKIKISNGSFIIEDYVFPGELSKVLCIGNSMTIHPINSYWWGSWGMAASLRERDYVHKLQNKIRSSFNEGCVCDAVNIAQSFEQGGNTDITSCVNAADIKSSNDIVPNLPNYDLFVIRLGENVTDVSSLQSNLESLITSIQTINDEADIIVTGMFWQNSSKETALQNAATAKSVNFVKIDQYGTSEYAAHIGDLVYGDDGNWHTINNQGVASHPSDVGMEAIASAIMNKIIEIQ